MTDSQRPGPMTDSSPRPAMRPSLMGSDLSAPASSGEAVSILSAVDQPSVPAAAPPTRKLASLPIWLGVTMLALIGLASWMEWSGSKVTSVPAVAVQPPPVVAAAPTPAAVAPAPVAEPLPQVATIENEAANPLDVLKSEASAATEKSSPVAPPEPAAKHKTAAETKAAEPVRKPKSQAAQRSPFAAVQSPPPPDPKRRSPASAANTDVDLLAALLAHTPGPAPKPVAARPKLSTKLSSVEPQPSTRERLSLCNLMQPKDVGRCRANVCRDKWGKDAACPAGSEPPSRKAGE